MQATRNWDPSYRHEDIGFYQEYIHRTAPIALNWFEPAFLHGIQQEVTAVNILFDNGSQIADKLIGTLEDGAIAIWDARTSSPSAGKIVATKSECLPSWNQRLHPIVEGASIDSVSGTAYFATSDCVRKLDLETLTVIDEFTSTHGQICAISEAQQGLPLTVATHGAVKLWDSRQANKSRPCDSCLLPEPDKRPLSVLHIPGFSGSLDASSIWVGGRFSHLLNFDRRMFPQILQTVHSGAHITSLAAIPDAYFQPRELNLKNSSLLPTSEVVAAKERMGHTIIAAGNYRGVGSLELHGVTPYPMQRTGFKNRQTIAYAGALAIAPHGGRIVYADASGNLKWLERDGFTPVRSLNINTAMERGARECGSVASIVEHFAASISPRATWGDQGMAGPWGSHDVVKRILPTRPHSTTDGGGSLGDDNLAVWTEEGKVGLVSFGREKWAWEVEKPKEYEDPVMEEAARDYDDGMRRLLLHHENELNFVRGFGLGAS